jgi:ATP-dependent Clp protease protease subunit
MEDNIRHLEESKRLNKRLVELYAKHNSANKTYDELANTMKFDTFLSAQEAVEWGLADKVVESR